MAAARGTGRETETGDGTKTVTGELLGPGVIDKILYRLLYSD